MKRFTSKTQKIGQVGEKIALDYLIRLQFIILETNYTKKIGEIDIVAMKSGKLHFIEVKTLLIDILNGLNVSRETGTGKSYDPWQNVSREKLRRFGRTCELYLIEKRVSHETKWQIDAIAVTITRQVLFDENGVSRETTRAKVEAIWNVVV